MATYLVMKNNLKRFLQHKTIYGITFLLPLIICILFGLVDFDKVSLRVGILTGEESRLVSDSEEELMQSLGAAENKELSGLYQVLDRSEGISYAKAREESLNMDLMTGHFQAVLDCRGQKLKDIRVIAYKPSGYVEYLQQAVTAAIVNQQPLQLTGLKQKGLRETERTLTMLLTLFFVFSILYASPLIRDKQTGTLLRYRYAQNSKAAYLGGYMASVFLLTLAQVLLCMAMLSILSRNFALGLLHTVLMAVVIAGLATLSSVLICYISKSEVQAGVLASAASVLMSLLGGTFVAVEAMPWLLRLLSYASPMRWVVELLQLI